MDKQFRVDTLEVAGFLRAVEPALEEVLLAVPELFLAAGSAFFIIAPVRLIAKVAQDEVPDHSESGEPDDETDEEEDHN